MAGIKEPENVERGFLVHGQRCSTVKTLVLLSPLLDLIQCNSNQNLATYFININKVILKLKAQEMKQLS